MEGISVWLFPTTDFGNFRVSSDYPSWLLNLQVRNQRIPEQFWDVCLLCVSRKLTRKSYWTSGAQILLKYRIHPPQNYRRQKGDTQKVPYWGPTTTTIRYYGTNFNRHGNLAPEICAFLYWTSVANPDLEVRSSGRVYNAAVYPSARPNCRSGFART